MATIKMELAEKCCQRAGNRLALVLEVLVKGARRLRDFCDLKGALAVPIK